MFPIRDHNPSGRTPYVTWGLVAVNVVVFLIMWPSYSNGPEITRIFATWALVPGFVTESGNPVTFLTSMFMHGGLMHLVGNMLFLWIFGDNMEDQFGHLPFLAFYIVSGVGAALAQYLPDPTSMVPMVGASGAIAGVMGGYLLLFPKARVDIIIILIIIFRTFTLPAWIVLGVWIGMQTFSGVSTLGTEGGGVAYLAHIGGFVAGLALTIPWWLRQGGPAFWSRTHGTPPHPEAEYPWRKSSIPRVPRRKR